ncbi:MAG TPA: phasin family protein [Methylocystis sp.]|nr:phasin family protein [Methylocystis sp.]
MTWDSYNPSKSAGTSAEAAQTYASKAINLGVQNVNSALKFYEEVARAKSPTDFANALTNYNRQTFETFTQAFGALAEFGRASVTKAEESVRPGLGD